MNNHHLTWIHCRVSTADLVVPWHCNQVHGEDWPYRQGSDDRWWQVGGCGWLRWCVWQSRVCTLGKSADIAMPNAFLGVAKFWSRATPRFQNYLGLGGSPIANTNWRHWLLDSDKLKDKSEFACYDFGCNELRMLASVEILRQGRLGTKRSLTFRPEFTFFPQFFPYMYVYSHTHIYIYIHV
jgi:hypothetical protein